MSIRRFRRALHLTIKKHAVFHSSVFRDRTTNEWTQEVEPLIDEGFSLVTSELSDNLVAIEDLIQNEFTMGIHDVNHGRLVRLHIVRKWVNHEKDNDELLHGDIIIINIRHEAIDGTSVPLFFDNLREAYSTGELPIDPNAIRYLDYILYLQQVDLSSSFAYWNQQMASFNFARHFKGIPHDRP